MGMLNVVNDERLTRKKEKKIDKIVREIILTFNRFEEKDERVCDS